MISKPFKLTSLYTTAEKSGAQFAERGDWQIPELFSTVEAEVAAARRRVALADVSANGKLMVEGEQAAEVLRSAWGAPPLGVNAGAAVTAGHVYRLRADVFFVSTAPGAEVEALHAVESAAQSIGGLITVTDITHGRAELLLVGPDGAELLSRLCGLDLHESQFPNGTAKQTSVAKTTQIIIRRDIGETPAYSLIGARSYGAYMWETIMEAGRDGSIVPIGLAALEILGS